MPCRSININLLSALLSRWDVLLKNGLFVKKPQTYKCSFQKGRKLNPWLCPYIIWRIKHLWKVQTVKSMLSWILQWWELFIKAISSHIIRINTPMIIKQTQKSFSEISRHGNRKTVNLNLYVDNKTRLWFGLSISCLQLPFSVAQTAGSWNPAPYKV